MKTPKAKEPELRRLFEDVPTVDEAYAERRSREADYTPIPLAVACLERSITFDPDSNVVMVGGFDGARFFLEASRGPLTVIDLCAGAGSWSIAIRIVAAKLGFPVHITAVEIDPNERVHLERNADRVVIGDYRLALRSEPVESLGGATLARHFDLGIGNPAFSLLRAIKEGKVYDPKQSMVAVALKHCSAVGLYHTQQTFTKTEPGYCVRRRYKPSLVIDIPGSVGHRGPGQGGDMVPYSFTVWRPRFTGRTELDLLDDLPPESRGWKTRPGTEEWLGELAVAPAI